MSYKLAFHLQALDEWNKLDASIRLQFKKKLEERLSMPRLESAKVSGAKDIYKIKLRAIGYRLVYQVQDSKVTVFVVAVGKRERNAAYKAALGRV
jgi:mRNA interferase RelE/StbE